MTLKRTQKRTRIWITLLADAALIQMASRPNISVDDLAELRSRVVKLNTAAEDLAARLKESHK